MTEDERIFTPAHAAPASEAEPLDHDRAQIPEAAAPAHAAPAEPLNAAPTAARHAPEPGQGHEPLRNATAEPPEPVDGPAEGVPAETDRQTAPRDDGDESEADTTAEIDAEAVEAQLSSPGSTQSFSPIPDERVDTDSTYDAGTTTSLMWGARSDVGCVRTHNEDSYLVQSPLFCVCDGMGGHAAGEVASSIAVETIAKAAPASADPAALASAVEAANTAIIEAAANGVGKPGMGCTATAAYVEKGTLAIAHVGDSRAYLVHEGTLIRVTRDHSYVEELVDAGEITADEARVHPNRSVITRALGSDPAMYADHFQLNIEDGDRLILCSDGLSSMITDSEIEQISRQSETAQICTDNLVDAALAAGGSDNVTVLVIDIVDDGRMRDVTRRRRRNIIIAVVAALVVFAVAAIALAYSISTSVFLGVSDGHVAIYTGLPEEALGIPLYKISDTTAIELDDLPQDTQNRLNAGIPQSSMDQARDTIAQYREQIDAEQTRQVQDAETIRGGSSDDAAEASGDAETEAAGGPADTVGGGSLADSVAPTKDGDAQ